MTDLALFRMIASEFSATSDSDVTSWISIAAGTMDSDYFGAQFQLAKVYLGAHLLKMSGLDSASGGPISSERAGDLAVSYAVSAAGDVLESTSYGRLFAQLRRSRPGRAVGLISI